MEHYDLFCEKTSDQYGAHKNGLACIKTQRI